MDKIMMSFTLGFYVMAGSSVIFGDSEIYSSAFLICGTVWHAVSVSCARREGH